MDNYLRKSAAMKNLLLPLPAIFATRKICFCAEPSLSPPYTIITSVEQSLIAADTKLNTSTKNYS